MYFCLGNSAKVTYKFVYMIEFIEENERLSLPCSGIFISIPIARLVYRSLCSISKSTLSDVDQGFLDEFTSCIKSKLDLYDLRNLCNC